MPNPSRLERRKLRRGTTSCWECKRRKTKCHFEQGKSTACESCQRRGCKCVLQDVEQKDLVDQTARNRNLRAQMDHLETVVDQLVHLPARPSAQGGNSEARVEETTAALEKGNDNTLRKVSRQQTGRQLPPSTSRRRLLPKLDKASAKDSHAPANDSLNTMNQSLQPLSSRQPPIDLARSLFQLAICLQQSDRFPEISKLWLDHSNCDAADQYFEAASRYVTSQDSLVVSYEGIETLMLEGLYHVSCGRLQLAWLVFRRALGIAHLVGLHIPQRRRQGKQQGSTSGSSPMCPATLWFRLVFMDRYLSLVLDLPMSVQDDSFMDDLVDLAPLEKLERAQAKLTSRIIFRNEQLRLGQRGGDPAYDHYKETKDIDYLLSQATRSLPAQWWVFPRPQDARSADELRDMVAKIVHQLHHYNFVLLLHIPYILPGADGRRSNDAAHDYSNSKIAAMTAARELLSRSIVPIGSNRVSFSTRGIVLKVLLSALTLLAVHLDSHRLGRENALGHQRPGDLITAERAIQSLETMGQKYDDKLCSSAARALRRMSAIEATAAGGVSYRTWSEPSDMVCTECIVQEEANAVQMSFPHVGIINILRQEPQDSIQTTSNGLRTLLETDNLDGGLLTPSWAWSDSPLSSWPEQTLADSNVDDVEDLPIGTELIYHGIQEAWALNKSDVEAINAPPTELNLQNYEGQGWNSNDQRPLLLEETFNATTFGS
ncbi:hypothetical protein M441DRAFT_151739 [Trichoderma asperellum CBS 433.97]|uniref:Zn(2)-C6 fungal-type domain-containing protein n=1 Tax=Trichoderma asperellum (strain ATCC 204424 / CBS 433.97 / NBRC 101777) TaxID=1042311 RepID=A0A2T3YUT9_TRIA4|nr:hypothetical protein M441DRAFT_151739 [Trichoderma asperellum CBS 433.97]PTB36284.1 hypothetical protein M441DRAFT_151739 [Trichoderma asperellum CBS 433.97]